MEKNNKNEANGLQKKKDKAIAPIKARLKEYLKVKKIKSIAFCEAINVGTPVLRQIYSEFTAPTISRILQVYPDLSPDWLLMGIGKMSRGDNAPIQTNENEILLPISEIKRITDEAQLSLRMAQSANAQLLADKDKQLKEKDKRIKELSLEVKDKDKMIKNYIEKKK